MDKLINMDKLKLENEPEIKIMYLNPIGTSAYDQTFADMAKIYKYPFTEVVITSMNPETVPPKMTNLEFRTYEAFIVRDTVEAARYCAVHDFDAMVIGCFYDPALLAAREISQNTLVVAPCQSALQVAATLGNTFSIIIGEQKWEDQMRQTVYEYGYKDQLISFESVGLRVEDFHKDPALTYDKLLKAALNGVTKGAEVIILGCTLEIGFYAELQKYFYEYGRDIIPVIDASIVSLKAAENAAYQKRWGWVNSRVAGMKPPPEEELKRFDMLQNEYKFGNIINVPAT